MKGALGRRGAGSGRGDWVEQGVGRGRPGCAEGVGRTSVSGRGFGSRGDLGRGDPMSGESLRIRLGVANWVCGVGR
jgi:hypothetical protein